MNRFLFILWIVALFGTNSIAQTTKPSENKDSVRLEILGNQTHLIEEYTALRASDSLKMASLEKQIRELKEGEKTKKRTLEQEFNQTRLQDSLRTLHQIRTIDSLKKTFSGYPVAPFKTDTLLIFYSNIASFTPKERSAGQEKKITELANDLRFDPDSLLIIDGEMSTNIVYKELIIAGISDVDALWYHTDRHTLATRYRENIVKAITRYQNETSWKTILIKSGLALLILLALGFIIHLITRLFRWVRTKIETIGAMKLKGVHIKGYALLDTEREIKIAIMITGFVKWITYLLAIYLSLPLIFSMFPWTEHLSDMLLSLFLDPLATIFKAIINYLPNLITIIVIIIVFRFVLKGLHFLKREVEEEALKIPAFHPELANPTFQIIRVLIIAFMLVVIFPYLPGSDSPIFKGVSVFLGVLFTFGSSGSLSNLIAGFVLTYMRSFKIGDRIRVNQDTGDVVEKGMLVTRIRTPKNEIISIPNSNVLNNNLINYSSEATTTGLIIYANISIGYDTEWREVHRLLITAALNTKNLEKEPPPFVLQTALDDFYVSYQINAYTKAPNQQASIYSELFQNIQDQFNEAGVQIMSPHYEADKETVVIPERYRNKNGSNEKHS